MRQHLHHHHQVIVVRLLLRALSLVYQIEQQRYELKTIQKPHVHQLPQEN